MTLITRVQRYVRQEYIQYYCSLIVQKLIRSDSPELEYDDEGNLKGNKDVGPQPVCFEH